MLPKLNRKRALFVLTKIDEILAWEQQTFSSRQYCPARTSHKYLPSSTNRV